MKRILDFNTSHISLVYCLMNEIWRKKLGLYASIYGKFLGAGYQQVVTLVVWKGKGNTGWSDLKLIGSCRNQLLGCIDTQERMDSFAARFLVGQYVSKLSFPKIMFFIAYLSFRYCTVGIISTNN